ncbi:lytic transglycosylase domain-containing protein [Aureimonas leprariae]|nr:transglycosylase SLT domain-containing protein [Aureimonas leprariae]
MPAARGTIIRALSIETRKVRSLGMVALAAPLALGACVAENNAMRSSALVRKPPQAAAPTGGPDAYGYAPVRLAALEDGARIALPSAKPDWEKLQAAEAQRAAAPDAAATLAGGTAKPATVAASATAVPQAAASQPPVDEIAALKADVAERRAALVIMSTGKGDRLATQSTETQAAAAQTAAVAKPAEVAAARAPATIASARDILDPRKSVPVALSTVAQSASALKVAAVDTTAAAVSGTKRAFDVVGSRIGDTFMTDDTITGSAAIDRMIEKSAAENNIPSELAYAVVRVESHYKPNVVGGGAYGLSQIKPATARSLGFDGPAKGLFDPETNLRYGMKYLAGAWEKSGHDICGTAMRYKGGHRTTTMTRAAADYCSSVKRHMAAIERSRAPANRETLVAAAERQKHIGEANRAIVDLNARARVLAAGVATNAPAKAPVAVAAASQPGRTVAASGAPVATNAAATVSAGSIVPAKSGRIVRVFSDGAASSTIAADGRFGYAD